MNPDLMTAVRERRLLLFVGAGVSMNLGLPSFAKLIAHLADELDFDSELFSTHGDYMALAEYYVLQNGSLGPLRSWMDKAWHEGVEIGSSKIHKRIVDLDFPVTYTTNYDNWLERSYEHYEQPYCKVASVAQLATCKPNETPIVKFHGDFDDDSTIVLTESQYFDRLGFESPLDIRLRSDLLEYGALFIGYSLSDINLRYMLYRLDRIWQTSNVPAVRPSSFMFLTRPNPVQECLLKGRGIQPIVSDQDDHGVGMLEFLDSLYKEVNGGGD